MLRKIRRITAVVLFALVTLLFLDFTGSVHLWFGWLAKIQLIPAILAVNVTAIVILVLLAILFGRIYCSVICPLGVVQDGVSAVAGGRKGKKNRFRFSKAKSWLRYGVLALFIAALIAGVSVVVSLLDPYAAYGRMAAGFLAPLYRLGNNLLAWFAEKADSYAFYSTEVWVKSWITFSVALVTLAVVGILAWRNGRTYCNTICPVGTILGLISRISIFRPAFDEEKCTKCGLCEKRCKSSCIDYKNMSVDMSRCVTCFNCIEACKFDAMHYTSRRSGKKTASTAGEKVTAGAKAAPAKAAEATKSAAGATKAAGTAKKTTASGAATKKTAAKPAATKTAKEKDGISRRTFLAIAGAFAVTHTVKAQQLQLDGGLAEIEDKKVPDRQTPIVPPGAEGLSHMKQHCTACQLCVSACPNNILKPSAKLATLMQPEMTFENGYCRPECVECSQVCPTGAIKPITAAEKTGISTGLAVWVKDNCIVLNDNLKCTACEYHCPTKAISLVPIDPSNRRSLSTPVVDKELCIGCGACEYLCPARPFSAIYVEGNVRHHAV